MRQRNSYIQPQNDAILSPNEKDFINHLIDFLPSNLKRDDQDIIDYYIQNFDLLRDYAFKLNPNVVKNLNIKARSVFLAYHPTIRIQFHEKTDLDKFLLAFPKKIKSYTPESRTEYFRLLPRLILNEDKTQIFPQFRQKSFFQSIVNNLSFTPAYNFLIDLPQMVSDSLLTVLKQIGIPDMVVDIMRQIDDPNVSLNEDFDYDLHLNKYQKNIKMKQAQTLFCEYVRVNMVIDIPESLLRNNAFEQIVQNAVIERRYSTFEFLVKIMTYNTKLLKSEKWNDLYSIIYSHYDDYCNILLNTKPFDQCCQMCFYILCNIVIATNKLPENFIQIFLRLTNEFFSVEKKSVGNEEIANKEQTAQTEETVDKAQLTQTEETVDKEQTTQNEETVDKEQLAQNEEKIDKSQLDQDEEIADKEQLAKNKEMTNNTEINDNGNSSNGFYNSHNSFLHICYVDLFRLLYSKNLLTLELIEQVDLIDRLTDFYINMNSDVFYPQKMHCVKLFTVLDPLISNYLLHPNDVSFTFDELKWEICKEEIAGIRKVIQNPYGVSRFQLNKSRSNSPAKGFFFIIILFLMVILAFRSLI